jgi:hypothetical protein
MLAIRKSPAEPIAVATEKAMKRCTRADDTPKGGGDKKKEEYYVAITSGGHVLRIYRTDSGQPLLTEEARFGVNVNSIVLHGGMLFVSLGTSLLFCGALGDYRNPFAEVWRPPLEDNCPGRTGFISMAAEEDPSGMLAGGTHDGHVVIICPASGQLVRHWRAHMVATCRVCCLSKAVH